MDVPVLGGLFGGLHKPECKDDFSNSCSKSWSKSRGHKAKGKKECKDDRRGGKRP